MIRFLRFLTRPRTRWVCLVCGANVSEPSEHTIHGALLDREAS